MGQRFHHLEMLLELEALLPGSLLQLLEGLATSTSKHAHERWRAVVTGCEDLRSPESLHSTEAGGLRENTQYGSHCFVKPNLESDSHQFSDSVIVTR